MGIRSGTPEPHYRLVASIEAVQIREYAPRIAAGTVVDADEITARSEGFTRLAAFIFGANTAARSIEMTAPVVQAGASSKIEMTAPVIQGKNAAGRWEIQFIMPAGYTMQTLPRPKDARIEILQLPAETFAVYRFTGARGPNAEAAARHILADALRGSAWHALGDPVAWFYDPPWTIPWFRRNEVAVSVVKSR